MLLPASPARSIELKTIKLNSSMKINAEDNDGNSSVENSSIDCNIFGQLDGIDENSVENLKRYVYL
jgi:hypothetical protein